MKDPRPCHLVKNQSSGLSIPKSDLSEPLFGECSEILSKTPLNPTDPTLMVIKEIFKNSIVEK